MATATPKDSTLTLLGPISTHVDLDMIKLFCTFVGNTIFVCELAACKVSEVCVRKEKCYNCGHYVPARSP